MAIANTDPILNDPNNPLISIFIYNFDKNYLRQCLEIIFNQSIISNLEVIIIDDATLDGSWDIELEYLALYNKRITLQRNRKVLGPNRNLQICLEMVKGKYFITLTNTQTFLPEYFDNAIKTMIEDRYAKFDLVYRTSDPGFSIPRRLSMPVITDKPLVSILCYNYNYGRYLRQSLESVFAQTYENIELCFSDNASTDESWQIAIEFAKKYPERMYIVRNRMNLGPDANFANCRRVMQGKYYINFCSDDVLEPEYVERCVNLMEPNPNVGLVIVNRTIIDEKGKQTEEAPFYNQTCIIPGEEQAAVYMMAGVNPSVSQIMYRSALVNYGAIVGGLVSRYYGTRILDFNISLYFDIGYIKEPLLLNRIHGQSDTNQADSNLLPIIGLYILNHQFADSASVLNLSKVTNRLPQSIDKIANLAVRYCIRYLTSGKEETAKRYFHLAIAINPKLASDAIWKQLKEFWESDSTHKQKILNELNSLANLVSRNISYDAPSGSIKVNQEVKAF